MPYPLESIGDGSIADRNFQRLAKDMNPPVPQARVYNNANIAVVTATATALTFNSERYDNGGLHSTAANTSRLTAPITGLYEIGCCVEFAASAVGIRNAFIQLNGATNIGMVQDDTSAGANWIGSLTVQYQLAATDYVEVVVAQNSGGNLNVLSTANRSPEFWMARLGGYVNQGV